MRSPGREKAATTCVVCELFAKRKMFPRPFAQPESLVHGYRALCSVASTPSHDYLIVSESFHCYLSHSKDSAKPQFASVESGRPVACMKCGGGLVSFAQFERLGAWRLGTLH